jgi:hypothetical protein
MYRVMGSEVQGSEVQKFWVQRLLVTGSWMLVWILI